MRLLQREHYPYTPLFCEENIWWLARCLLEEGMDAEQMQVLFFSNAGMQILLMNQRAAGPGQPIIWDYHVVLRASMNDSDWIMDFDTRLPFMTPLEAYLLGTFPLQNELPEQYRTWVRSIPAQSYLDHFFSDRSHMKGRIPESEFPEWDIIQPDDQKESIALSDYWNMETSLGDGSYTYPVTSA